MTVFFLKKLKYYIAFILIFFSFLNAQETENFINTDSKITMIEISITDFDINIFSYKPAEQYSQQFSYIKYKVELKNKSSIHISQHGSKISFSEISPASGKIFIYVPENFLLESCRIQSVNSKIKINGIKSVYLALSCTSSEIELRDSKIKNFLSAMSGGNLYFKSSIVSTADFCLSSVNALIFIPEEKNECVFFITHNNEFLFEGKPYKQKFITSSKTNKKKFTVSAVNGSLSISFIEIFKEPDEKINQYGISEFGPKRSPIKVNELANFLPKNNF